MNKSVIIAILLIALVLIVGCAATTPTGDEGKGSRDAGTTEDSELEEDVDTSELDDIEIDESLF